ncbi:MAG: hypothetical protein JXM70_18855 [Pirellulales bacterium]|nr:hypothetical protein [Pirellulales bacterium]
MMAKLSAHFRSPFKKGVPLLACPAVFFGRLFHSLLDEPAVAPRNTQIRFFLLAARGTRQTCLLIAASTVLLTGCGPDLPKTVPVSGTIVYQGKPVVGAEVTFMREGIQPGRGTTDERGYFELTTYYSSDYEALKGAIPGDCVVKVTKTESLAKAGESFEEFMARNRGRVPKSLIPTRYANPKTTDLKAKVSEVAENHFDFVLVD